MGNTPSTPQEPLTLDEQINKAIENVDEKGKILFDDTIDPIFKRAVINEKKARDTQASFTRGQQELARLKATADVLTVQLSKGATLTAEQVEELEELKYKNPDVWFSKKSQFENESKAKMDSQLKELTDAAANKALNELTLLERQTAVANFQARTGIELTDDVMAKDIPARLQDKLLTMPFDDYLLEVAAYLKKSKVIKQTDDSLDQVNLGTLAGGSQTSPSRSSKYQIL